MVLLPAITPSTRDTGRLASGNRRVRNTNLDERAQSSGHAEYSPLGLLMSHPPSRSFGLLLHFCPQGREGGSLQCN